MGKPRPALLATG